LGCATVTLDQSGGDLNLSRPSSRPLACDDHTPVQQLAPPHTPWLAPAKSAGEALETNRTGATEILGPLDGLRLLSKEQLRGVKTGKLTAIAVEVLNNR
jgi:hypothetical protein